MLTPISPSFCPCDLALGVIRSKTGRVLDDIRKDTYLVIVVLKILEQAPASLVTVWLVCWSWTYSCD